MEVRAGEDGLTRDYLVGAGVRCGNIQAERFRSLEVYHELD